MPPARERLGTDDAAGGYGNLWLEEDFDFILVEGAAKIDFKPVTKGAFTVAACLKDTDWARFGRLGFGKRGAGAAKQKRGVIARLGGDNPGSAAERDHMIARHEWTGGCFNQFTGKEAAFGKAGGGAKENSKFRAGDARHQAAAAVGADAAFDTASSRLKNRVAGAPAERGVDRVEATDGEQDADQSGLLRR